jgi:uncharacterized protein YecE (DUF72 family)
MPKVYYGTDDTSESWETHFEQSTAMELELERFNNEPKSSTLHQWQVESPQGFCFILHADPEVQSRLNALAGPDAEPAIDDALREAWDTTLERADALGAKAILLKTPGSLTPGDANRELLQAFADAVGPDTDPEIIWEPSGMWTIEQTVQAGKNAGLVPAYDPFLARREEVEFTHGDAAFIITERAAMRRQFDTFDFENLLGWTRKYDRLFCMMRGRHRWAHVDHMRTALEHVMR